MKKLPLRWGLLRRLGNLASLDDLFSLPLKLERQGGGVQKGRPPQSFLIARAEFLFSFCAVAKQGTVSVEALPPHSAITKMC